MHTLSRTLRKSKNAEKAFKHKSVLFIPSESYCAAAITVLQGLQELGFTVYTYKKPNINSWFCNEVISKVQPWMRFDFILSNMHWGTQWHLYNELTLHGYPKVLIDGCDNRGRHTWRDKYRFYRKKYKMSRPPEPVLSQDVQPCRWMEPLDEYKPDVVFTSQKNPGDRKTAYLPFGIHREYLKFREGKSGSERSVDFANILGSGDKRRQLTEYLKAHKLIGKMHNSSVRGTVEFPKPIRKMAMADNNVHSYHRWGRDWAYFKLLNDTKILLYPGVYDRPHWDSKRPWEGWVSGCLVMAEKPPIDMAEYPMTELCPPAVYGSLEEMEEKCLFFHRNPGWAEQQRLRAVEGALRHFTSVPLARYFLWRVLEAL